jgi:hypothetical protein
VFKNNGQNAYSDSSPNSWNSTTMLGYVFNGQTYTNYTGNYWGDYKGTGVDGIGITPYMISTSDVDYYPMVSTVTNSNPQTSSGGSSSGSSSSGSLGSYGLNRVTATPTPTPTATPIATPTPTPTPTITPVPSVTPTPTSAPTATPMPPQGFTAWWLVALLVVIVVAIAAAYSYMRK